MTTALITGASSGIGARAAALLVEQGLTVFGAARNTDAVAAIGGVTPVALDLTSDDSIRSAVATVTKAAGTVDVLINCAGYGEFGSLEETSLDAARQQLEVNVVGAVGLVQALLPGMREAGHGRIVNVSSLAGEFAAPLGGWYHASKFALEALSDSLRGEVSQFGIDVTLVQPSYVATDWHDTAMEHLDQTSGRGPYASMAAAMRRYFGSPALAKQMSTPDAVAELIVKAALTPRPRTRYRIGAGANVAVAMATLLPDRTFDALTRKQFGYAA
ncbi:oxidoreductase [Humibacter ginsenosidimutans]|uniref:SDR family NAD(P)-dependent oxidoreductase n=1 Tax=Humibacter ginsenosidimutans TaxID=2599293 RepID=A0A5B8M3T6_9MICO|nr:oxidoreductase [Humibacter ginsenosidimutans]QDZ15448.1 SDR family NAD(P)-dependent oxidoreductase [Humibacter ginsenosidimutans]